MKVSNMVNNRGNIIKNQFILEDNDGYEYFQSYDSIIVKRTKYDGAIKTILDERYWNYSKTTSKYRNEFLGESTKETQAKINSGEYLLADLNEGK